MCDNIVQFNVYDTQWRKNKSFPYEELSLFTIEKVENKVSEMDMEHLIFIKMKITKKVDNNIVGLFKVDNPKFATSSSPFS